MQISAEVKQSVRLLEAVADTNRLRIIKCLQVRSACVCELVQATLIPQPRVSRHLRILRDAGLVEDSRDAQWVEYSLAETDGSSPEAQLLALVAGWLADDPTTRGDLERYATATKEKCCDPVRPGDE